MQNVFYKAIITFFLLIAPIMAQWDVQKQLYYGFEINGKVMGYVEVNVVPEQDSTITVYSTVFAQMSLMGQPFDLKIDDIIKLSSHGDRISLDTSTIQGESTTGSLIEVIADEIRFTSKPGGETKTIKAENVIFENTPYLTFLIEDFAKEKEKIYTAYNDQNGSADQVTYKKLEEEELFLAGEKYHAVVFERFNKNTGEIIKLWISSDDGCWLRSELPGNITISLSYPNIIGKIKRANLDNLLFARVDAAIANFQEISYMKVKAAVRTVGEHVTVESLNVPGQSFVGSVKENFIDGIFEVKHQRYDGINAPPFPHSYNQELKLYLIPENLIETTAPEIIETARKIVKDSKNSWQAVQKISQWVSKNITYKIPGGSALQTLNSKEGECASHSRLVTALCRSVGIPTRIVGGCMYTPLYGGSFGQHAWNEVYMGDAGWIPIDATADEIDYIDSGHIRLSNMASFNPQKMEVLEYKAGLASKNKLNRITKIPWKIGKKYTYSYSYQGQKLGTDSFTIDGYKQGVYSGSNELDITGLNTSGKWQINVNGQPLNYNLKGKTPSFEYTLECTFEKNKVTEKVIKGLWPTTKTVDLKGNEYLFDNSNMGPLSFILAAVPLEKGTNITIKVFHPSSIQILPVQIKVIEKETIVHNEEKTPSWRIEISLAGKPLIVWVNEMGLLLRETENNGQLVINLEE